MVPAVSIGGPVAYAHNAVARTLYASIRVGVTALGLGFDTTLRRDPYADEATRAVVNGLWGTRSAGTRTDWVSRWPFEMHPGSR